MSKLGKLENEDIGRKGVGAYHSAPLSSTTCIKSTNYPTHVV